ncbi:MAG TPA: hypothetical protein ACHBZ9_08160 [Arsenophonus nasoniae]|uniref:hypothetical protein n=1 Tax=Arsenophonus nasoniae TaxID=638 RepID=UPI00387A095B
MRTNNLRNFTLVIYQNINKGCTRFSENIMSYFGQSVITAYQEKERIFYDDPCSLSKR